MALADREWDQQPDGDDLDHAGHGAGLSDAVLRLEERFCGKVLVVNLSEMEGEET